MAQGSVVRAEDLGLKQVRDTTGRVEDMTLEEVKSLLVQRALARFEGNVSRAVQPGTATALSTACSISSSSSSSGSRCRQHAPRASAVQSCKLYSPNPVNPLSKPHRSHERTVLWMVVLAGLPGALVSAVLLWTRDYSAKLQWTLVLFIAAIWLGSAFAVRWRAVFRCKPSPISLLRLVRATTRFGHAGRELAMF